LRIATAGLRLDGVSMMHATAQALHFHIIRQLERRLSPEGLYRLLRVFTGGRAAVRETFRRRPPHALPGCFAPAIRIASKELRRSTRLNAVLENLPDRLGEPAWRERFRVAGFEELERARLKGRPVVLAFCHAGPFTLLRFCLRAAGVPAATLVRGKTLDRSALRRKQDRLSPFPEIPTAFYQDRLREGIAHLMAGHPLLMAIDGRAGKQMRVPLCDGWTFQMATGPLRMAANHGALLFSCLLMEEGDWRFGLEIGSPVPDALLAAESGWEEAGAHLMRQMWPILEAHADQCPEYFLERFQAVGQAGLAHTV
jgi:lauroyl/myristoyl acyltransferase